MSGGPTTPNIKRYIKTCEGLGYTPTAVKLSYSGDVMVYFDAEMYQSDPEADAWEAQIAKT